MAKHIRIGTAGWAIPRPVAPCFPGEGSTLARYASQFTAAEINSTFRRTHKAATYARWAATVPDNFRFSVKLPKAISHVARLADSEAAVENFAEEISALGDKLGPVLLQLPPSLAFERGVADSFCTLLRAHISQPVVCEPRHPSWFEADADSLLAAHGIARAAADPARIPSAARPGGACGLAYYRLHGSPRIYFSSYDEGFLSGIVAAILAADASETWCIYDNTASGAATANALATQMLLNQRVR